MDIRVILLLALEALFAFWLLRREGLVKKPAAALLSAGLIALAFVLRGLALDYETLDYQNFLAGWVAFFRENGGFRALARPIGNYNIPYLYFLALFSYSSIRDLYLIKLLSVFFDVLLAWAAMRLLGRVMKSGPARLGCFFTVLFLPTVVLNGALWGQCDSVYVSLALLGLALAMEKKPAAAMVCAALSFGFKLQAVFVLPVYALLWMRGDLKLRHFLLFPLVYVLLVLPAVLLGRPFLATLTLYFDQAGSVGSGLNYNSPSVYALFRGVADEAGAARLGILAAFVFLLAALAVCFAFRRRLSDRAVLAAALLLAVGIPFLLPHMHDRYFYAADILSVALAFSAWEYLPAPLLVQFASLLGYHAYLKMRYLLTMDYGAWALAAALLLSAAALGRALWKAPAPNAPGDEILS